MFTGIIEELGEVKSVGHRELVIRARKVLEGTGLGDSIAVDGVCLTVTALDSLAFTVEAMPQTLRLTNLGQLRPGDRVNLERPLSLGGRLGGHLVQGHVDATGRVASTTREEEAIMVRYAAPTEVMQFVVPKGFVAVNGVSLTVVDCDASSFRVSLVRYTQQNSNLGSRRIGDLVNLEADIVAKYLDKHLEKMREKGRAGITAEFLGEHGFLR